MRSYLWAGRCHAVEIRETFSARWARRAGWLGAIGAVLIGNLPAAPAGAAEPPVRVLILSGQNNHNWRQTTPKLEAILTSCGRFTVQITDRPDQLNAAALARYDVILSDWNTFPSDAKVKDWPAAMREDFLNYIRQGGGFVVVHAGSSSFENWTDYRRLAGGAWGKGTGHGPVHAFEVKLAGPEHPITQGLAPFQITDELWHNLEAQPRTVLATAFSDKAKGGSGQDEPVAVITTLGQGRGFNLVLGHDGKTMEAPGFQALLRRGTEWAATGKVTLSAAAAAAAGSVSADWEQTETTLALLRQGKPVWRLNFNRQPGKPYFHPVTLADGTELTAFRPADHIWHRALWWSWKFIDDLNYWEEDPQTGQSDGQTEMLDIQCAPRPDRSAKIEMKLAYHPRQAPPRLLETRVLAISAPDAAGSYRIDWTSTFTTAGQDVKLGRTPIPGQPGGVGYGGYAGFSARLAAATRSWIFTNSEGAVGEAATHGKPARWLDFSGTTAAGGAGGLALFDHPANLRHPSPWYVNQGMPYFSPALLFNEPYTLAAGSKRTLRYRALVHTGRLTPAALEQEWNDFRK